MTIPTLTTLPVAPARTDPPATFVTRADAFLAAIVTFQGEMNTSIGAMNTDIAGVNADAVSAAADAVSAAASAAAAEAASNATEWVSGTSYAEGDVVYSPIDFKSYRANTATSGTTDPSASADWTALGYALPTQTGNAGKYLTTDGTNESWSVVSAGGSITATASGAITAGDAVLINSDGTVSSPTVTDLTSSFVDYNFMPMKQSYFTSNTTFAEIQGARPIAFDENTGNFYFMCKMVDGSFYFNEISKISTDDYFRPSLEQSGTLRMPVSSYYFKHLNIALNHKNGTGLLAAQYNQNSEVSFVPLRFNDDTMSMSSSYNKRLLNNCSVVYNLWYLDDVDKYVVYYRNSSGYPAVATITSTSDDKYDFTVNTEYVVATASMGASDARYATGFYDKINNKFIFSYSDGTDYNCKVATLSGDTFSFGSQTTIQYLTIAFFKKSIDYSETEDVYLFAYQVNTNSSERMIAATLSGTTLTFGTELNTLLDTQYDGGMVTLDPFSKALIIGRYQFRTINISGTTLSTATSSQDIGNSSWVNNMEAKGALVYQKASGYVFAWGKYGDVSAAQVVSSNISPSVFVGFAEASVSDGETVDITVKSGTNTSQSGLVAGQGYYLDVYGNLTTIRTGIKAGVATSSTNLVMV